MSEIELQPRLPAGPRTGHRALFFRTWLQDPFHVASVWPSGRLLGKLMAQGLGPGSRVIELGAGTGTLTEAILERGVRPQDLYLVDQQPEFVGLLRRRFPESHVFDMNARDLSRGLGALAGSIDFVVSGLPLLWFDRDTKAGILTGAFELLRRGGCFHQFTYLGRPPIGPRLLKSLDLEAELVGISPINVPPAFVYRLRRSGHRHARLPRSGHRRKQSSLNDE